MITEKATTFPLKVTSFSPKGEFHFVQVLEPVLKMDEEDSKENYEYRLVLRLNEKDATAFINKLNATVAAAGFDLKSAKTHKFSLKPATERVVDPKDPEKFLKDSDGTYVKQVIDDQFDIAFQNYAYRKMKDGTFEQREIAVYDSASERVDPAAVPSIGNGTVGRVAFMAGTYDSTKKRGVKMYLQGIQIIELVERAGGSGGDIHFPVEEGFTAKATPVLDSMGSGFKASSVSAEAKISPKAEARATAVDLNDEIPF